MSIDVVKEFTCPTCGRNITLESGDHFPEQCRRCKTDLTAVAGIVDYANKFFIHGCAEFKNGNFLAAIKLFQHSLDLMHRPETKKALAVALICSGKFPEGLIKLKS